jgi:hypothetical protein
MNAPVPSPEACKIAKRLGYTDPILLRATPRATTLRASWQTVLRIVYDHREREALPLITEMMSAMASPELRIKTPGHVGVHEYKDVDVVTMDNLHGTPCASGVDVATHGRPSLPPGLLDTMASFVMKFDVEQAPEGVAELSAVIYSDDWLEERFRANLAKCVEHRLITPDEAESVLTMFGRFSKERRLQHHDFGPWNWLALPGDAVGLVDCEFAGDRYRLYDAIYLLLQYGVTYPYKAGMVAWAESLDRARQDAGHLTSFHELIAKASAALLYRLIASGVESARSPETRERFRFVLGAILERDYAALERFFFGDSSFA